MPDTHHILFYDYVEDIPSGARRTARRTWRRFAPRKRRRARSLMAGALGDPPHGAAIVFKDRAAAEAFA